MAIVLVLVPRVQDIASRAAVFEMLQSSGKSDQRHTIGAFELLCAVRSPSLTPAFPMILKFLYDADVLEEVRHGYKTITT